MPQHGISLRGALTNGGIFESTNGTVYYNGEDGNHAVYDVTAANEGSIIINGEHCTTPDGQVGVSQTLRGSEKYLMENGIDINSGWNICP